MAEDVASLTYELLKRLNVRFDKFEADLGEIKVRVSSLEAGQALLRQELSHQSVQIAALNARMDRFDERMTRIERRLDLIEA